MTIPGLRDPDSVSLPIEPASVTSMMIGDLVRQALDPEQDPWDLAIVQRDRVWDHLRVARLLDSLLVGYPIGSILLCRLRATPTGTVAVLDRDHEVRDVPVSTWQLVDGQQRLNALASLFAHIPESGTYYLDLLAERRPEDELATRRRQRAAATSYIAYRGDGLNEEYAPIPSRSTHLKLSGLAGWIGVGDERALTALRLLAGGDGLDNPASLLSQALARLAHPPSATDLRAALRFVEEIDPECRVSRPGTVTDSMMAKVASRLARLLAAWFAHVPVERRELDSEYDILQVFERINLAGVQVAGEDVFFAAVKTRWPAADAHLRRFASRVPAISHRRNALRLTVRLASVAEGRGDLLPLRVDRLNPPRGQELRTRIEALVDDGGTAVRRMALLSSLLEDTSGLGFALRDSLPSVLLDAALAWAAVNSKVDETGWLEEHLAEVAGFLLGATAFGHWNVFRVQFATLAFAEGIDAGLARRPFPSRSIAAQARHRWGVSRQLRPIRGHASDGERLALVNANTRLTLAIVQGLPFQMPTRTRGGVPIDGQQRRVEWDHVWPYDQRSQFRYSRRFAAGSDRIAHAGNFWALDAPLNNHARARLPAWKFSFLRQPTQVVSMPDLWPPGAEATLTADERAELMRIEAIATGERSAVSVADATRRFADLVDRRGLRLFNLLANDPRFRGWLEFSASAEFDSVEEDGPTSPGARGESVARELGLPAPHTTRLSPAGDDQFAPVLAQAARAGVDEDLRMVIDAARAAGFHVATRRTYLQPHEYRVGVALNRTNARRRDLCWFVPVVDHQVLRVGYSADNLQHQANIARDEARTIFGADGDREWPPGAGASLVIEIVISLSEGVLGQRPDSKFVAHPEQPGSQ